MPSISNHEAEALRHQSPSDKKMARGEHRGAIIFHLGVESGDQNFTVIPE
jgi:hypothetical protein